MVPDIITHTVMNFTNQTPLPAVEKMNIKLGAMMARAREVLFHGDNSRAFVGVLGRAFFDFLADWIIFCIT
jgi:uncharacterized membrane protein